MCPILAGWKLGDTVVNEREPAKTWTVTVTENKEQARWIEIQNTPDCEAIPGTRGMGAFESIFVSMGFHAYRNINTHLLFQAYRAISIKPIVYKVFKGYLLRKNYRVYSRFYCF